MRWRRATKIVYTDFATPYCSVYVADASAARICRLVCREARHSLSVQEPKHFWMTRMLNGGSIEFFLWYARHELCVAARRQKGCSPQQRRPDSSTRHSLFPTTILSGHLTDQCFAGQPLAVLPGAMGFAHYLRIEIVAGASLFRRSPEI